LQQEARFIVHKMLQRRFGKLPGWAETQLKDADREMLEEWIERAFDAKRLEDVLTLH
jgi:hypothetical protein